MSRRSRPPAKTAIQPVASAPLVISFGASAGGAGKSTCCTSAAAMLDALGLRVLVCDLDYGQRHSILRLRGETEDGSWGYSESYATYRPEIPTRAEIMAAGFDIVLADCPPAPRLQCSEPVDVAVYVVGQRKDIRTWEDAAGLLHQGRQAGMVVGLLNESDSSPALRNALDAVKASWNGKKRPVLLIPIRNKYRPELDYDQGWPDWDASYRRGIPPAPDGVTHLVAVLVSVLRPAA